MKKIILAIVLSFTALSSAHAESQKGILDVKSEVFKVVKTTNEKGEVESKLVSEAEAEMLPNDEVVYINTVTNIGNEPASNVAITNPISDALTYKAGSAFGTGTIISFSVDGGDTYALPGDLKIRGEDGKPRLAYPKEYNAVKWVFTPELRPGEVMTVSYRAMIGRED